jgi:hypothetical protein
MLMDHIYEAHAAVRHGAGGKDVTCPRTSLLGYGLIPIHPFLDRTIVVLLMAVTIESFALLSELVVA